MNVEIGTEAAQFPEKEYINGIYAAVQTGKILYRKASKERVGKKDECWQYMPLHPCGYAGGS